MRTAALIAASVAAFSLAACSQPETAKTDAPVEGATEAAEASGAAADTSGMAGGSSGSGASAAGGMSTGSRSGSGETMAPATPGSMPSDGAMMPSAQAPAAADNVTETQRRLNPPQNAPAQ